MYQIDRQAFRAVLKQFNLTQGQAADLIGMSRNSLSRKVLGKRSFTVPEMIDLCKLLDIKDPLAVFAPQLKELGAITPSSVGKAM